MVNKEEEKKANLFEQIQVFDIKQLEPTRPRSKQTGSRSAAMTTVT